MEKEKHIKKMKKTGFDLEKTVRTVEQISRNRLILAIFLVVDGIIFLMNPEQPVENMGRTLAICMVFAAGAMIFSKIVAKERFISFLPALLLLTAGGLLYFFPDALSAYFRLILALVIIINGAVNLSGVLGLGRVQDSVVAFKSKLEKIFSKVKTTKELEDGMEEQTNKYLRPLHQIVSESERNKAFFFVTNLLSVILGVLLLVRPDMSITIFGIVFIYVGINDFVMAFRTRKISEKLRDKKFREILFEETDEHENRAEGDSEERDQKT
jgi:uncharacterized membrane protein HdeD (DUF308 family)